MGVEQNERARQALALFADELSAFEYLEKILWPHGVTCPHCGGRERIGKLNGGSTRIGTYKCYRCRKMFTVTHGTIFRSSHVALHKWLQAIYLTEGGTKPMRPHHLQQILNVSFKTAASMIRRLGKAAAHQSFESAGLALHREPDDAEKPQAAAVPQSDTREPPRPYGDPSTFGGPH